jgi:hypothetical protein
MRDIFQLENMGEKTAAHVAGFLRIDLTSRKGGVSPIFSRRISK